MGRPPADYASTILKPSSWGGAIELAVVADDQNVEVWSIEVASGRVDRFGEGKGYSEAVMVVYSGIHYDALTLSFVEPSGDGGGSLEFDTTRFSLVNGEADSMLAAALTLVKGMRDDHAYTDTATFALKCEQCGVGLQGEKEARGHAEKTGHTRFGEY